ncbi:MAG: hypothetical protein C0591_09370 [Marinilabiliales bacterium]|nr:MAG: hypothetical protein C0591_09370 [Marinilabiliales bacterium]
MPNRIRLILSLVVGILVYSCQGDSQRSIRVDESALTKMDVHIKRYGEALFTIDTAQFGKGLQKIQPLFPHFLDADLNDSANIAQLYKFVTDTQTRKLFDKTMEVYPELNGLEANLADAFSRYHYFFPDNSIPHVYTYVSDMYFEQPVWINDTVMVVALDVYLGKDFILYPFLGLPQYKIRCMAPEYLATDILKAMYFEYIWPNPKQKTLLDRMIAGGKLLYYLDAVLPGTPDSIKLCYTEKKLEWAEENEKQVWAFIVQNELLYAMDFSTQSNLIQDGPFTTGFSNESPSRLGVFIGWKIIRAYMAEHPETSLQDLMNLNDAQLILQQSGYKP